MPRIKPRGVPAAAISPKTGMRGSRSAPIRPEKIPESGDFFENAKKFCICVIDKWENFI